MSFASRASVAADQFRRPALWVGVLVLGPLIALAGGGPAWGRVLGLALGGVGLAGLLAWLVRLDGLARQAERSTHLAAALAAVRQGWLIVDSAGEETLRSGLARTLLGPASDPLAPLLARARGDVQGDPQASAQGDAQRDAQGEAQGEGRAVEDLVRLQASAALGGVHTVDIALPGPQGTREWLAVAVHGLPKGSLLWSVEDISGRRAIEETLRREHEMLADFLDYMPVGFYSADTEGRIRHVNQRLAEWVGRSAGALTGMALKDVLGIEPDPEEDRAEMRLKGRSGDVFQAFVTHTVFDEGGETLTRSVIVRDLMPEGRSERALKAAERRFHWLFDDSPVGILLVDPDRTVSQANAAFVAMAGVPLERILGAPVSEFIHPADRATTDAELSKVLMGLVAPEGGVMGGAAGVHLPVRLAGHGRELVATLHVNPTEEEGATAGLMLHFIDTTEHKHLEIQFAQSQKMQAMGQLAGGVAHDFNNLLTAMIGFCDLLLQRHGPGDASFADVMQIKQNANRAASLVRQLLAFSRRQALQPRLFDVTDALADLSNLLHRLLGETIELAITHGRDLGLVRVDPGQFDQVIINLAVNARDAMPGGGKLAIHTTTELIERSVQRGDELMPPGAYVLITVSDTGTGISPDHVGRIFEPFFSTKEVGAGTGLGLSTVYGIVRQTGGFIFVDSQPGQGAAFNIYLPRFEAAPDTVEPTRPQTTDAPARSADLTGKGTVLLVEDEDAVRLFGARALRNQGYQVIEARSGEQALEVLRSESLIDALVTDVVMPGMDGATLARLVRIERPLIQVILMSGYAEDTALGEVSGKQGIHFLPKPFSLKQLAGKVKEALDNRA